MTRTAGFQAKVKQAGVAQASAPQPRAAVPEAIDLSAGVDPVEVAMAAAAVSIPHLLKPVEVAELLGIGERTLERWRGTGEGPRYISLSRKTVRYDAAEVAGFIAGRIKASTAQ